MATVRRPIPHGPDPPFTSNGNIVQYRATEDFPGWSKAERFLKETISAYRAKRVLEIGSGAKPTLSHEYVRTNSLDYTINDVSSAELEGAGSVYNTLRRDMCEGVMPRDLHASFDLIFSRMVNEHVRDGRRYYRNIHDLLVDGGLTVHCYSTLYAMPFVFNKFVPESVSRRVLRLVSPRDTSPHRKFKAHYSWSRGPTRRSIRNFRSLGFEVIEYVGYFGHGYYRKIPVLNRLEQLKSRVLLRAPCPYLTAYASVILRKKLLRTDETDRLQTDSFHALLSDPR